MADVAGIGTGRRATPTGLAAYRAVLASRMRAQRSYPMGFALDLAGSLLIGITEFGEVWVIFHNVQSLGGLDFHAILVVFGLSNFCFATADLFVGHLDQLPTFIRAGTLDAFYLRPQPVLAQLMTCELDLRRLSRIGVAMAAFIVGLCVVPIHWNPASVLLIASSLVFGSALMSGLFVCAASAQFFLVNAPELTNSFTYGGSYASQQPAAIFPGPLKLLFGYLVPVAFTAYLPALRLLGLPGPFGLPSWLGWFTGLAAAVVWGIAFGLWRLGTRHYQGGGG